MNHSPGWRLATVMVGNMPTYIYTVLRVQLLPLLFSSLLWQSYALGATPEPTFDLLAAALEKLDATNLDDDWYFSMALDEEGERRIIHSDPQRTEYERRELISVNGVVPDGQRQKKFREAEVKRIDELDPDATGYRHMIDAETLQLLERDDSSAKLSFVPRIKAMEESRDMLRGTALLNLKTQQIEQIEIYNTGELSPAFAVKVDSYRLTLRFQQEQGENLLKTLESRAVGTAGFLKEFDVLVFATFSDYKRAAP